VTIKRLGKIVLNEIFNKKIPSHCHISRTFILKHLFDFDKIGLLANWTKIKSAVKLCLKANIDRIFSYKFAECESRFVSQRKTAKICYD